MTTTCANSFEGIVQSQSQLQYQCVAVSTSVYESVNGGDSENNLPQGVQFSPDGLCVLTSAGNKLRLYNTPPHKPVDTETNNNKNKNKNKECSTNENENKNNTEKMEHPKYDIETDQRQPIHEWNAILEAKGGDTVRSYDWYPHMASSNPSTCCFVATSRDQPVHLYDAYTGSIRATYRPYNQLDELESPTIVSFSPDGQHIFCGGFRTNRCIHVFDTNLPGRESTISLLGKTRRSSDGQKGILSAICHSQNSNNLLAVGTFSPGSIYLYDQRTMGTVGTILNGVCVVGHGKSHSKKKRRFATIDDNDNNFDGDLFSSAKIRWFQSRAQGGVTQLKFGDNGTLFSASRRSDAVLAWDIRMMTSLESSRPICGIQSYPADHDTNQRLQFDFDTHGRLLVGGRDNCVRIYHIPTGTLVDTISGLHSAVNGVSCHGDFVALSVGSRVFPDDEFYNTDDNDDMAKPVVRGTLELYHANLKNATVDEDNRNV